MVDRFNKKKKYRKVLYSRITLVIVLILLVLVGRATWKVYNKERITSDTLDRVQKKHEELEGRREFLEDQTKVLSTEDGVEAEIRETYGLSREGEGIIVLVDGIEGEDLVNIEEPSFWEKLKSMFKTE